MKRICVYCGSSPGRGSRYAQAARNLGRALVENHLGLVYGGASVGTMGAIADAVLQAGGEVHGVIPEVLMDAEVAHPDLTELHKVNSMHERKALMAQLADGFIALPGGFGTLEELLEMITWAQLAIHRKPIGIINTDGYYDALINFFKHAVNERFIRHEQLAALLIDDSPQSLLARFRSYQAMPGKDWPDRAKP